MQESGRFPIHDSKFFSFIEMERREIEAVKWSESEKAGYDIGPERAHWVWVWRHRDAWIRGLKVSGLYP